MKSFKVENEHLTRQMDIIPMEALNREITVIGAGAVGSWTVMSLAKMGFQHITVFDDDAVSIENMNCQFFPYDAIGKSKADTLKALVLAFANVNINVVNARYLGDVVPKRSKKGTVLNNLKGIVISAVDSMEARKMIWDNAKKSSSVDNIIDPRMGAEVSLMYVMNPKDDKDISAYEKTLYSDQNAVQERCTAKATIYTANLLAGQVCKAIKDLVVHKPYTRIAQWDIGNNHAQFFIKKEAVATEPKR